MDDFNCCPLTLSSVVPQNLIIFISIILTFFSTIFFIDKAGRTPWREIGSDSTIDCYSVRR